MSTLNFELSTCILQKYVCIATILPGAHGAHTSYLAQNELISVR